MKWFVDGDQVCITQDDFVDLQESPAVLVPRNSEIGKIVEERGVLALPFGDFREIRDELNRQAEERRKNNGDYVADLVLALKTATAANAVGGWGQDSPFQQEIYELIERFDRESDGI